MNKTGTEFKKLREKSEMNMTKFSSFFGIPYRTVQTWEYGERKCPSYVLRMMQHILEEEEREKSDLIWYDCKKQDIETWAADQEKTLSESFGSQKNRRYRITANKQQKYVKIRLVNGIDFLQYGFSSEMFAVECDKTNTVCSFKWYWNSNPSTKEEVVDNIWNIFLENLKN